LPLFLENAEKEEDLKIREQDLFGPRPFNDAVVGPRHILREEDEEVHSLVSYLYQWLDMYARQFERGKMTMTQSKKAIQEIIQIAAPPPLLYVRNAKRRRKFSRTSAQPQLPPPGEGFIQRLAPFQNNICIAEILTQLAGIASWVEFEEDFIQESQALVKKEAVVNDVLSRMFSYVTNILKIYQICRVKEFNYNLPPPTPLREEETFYF
jgi:hypothetical protein